MTDRFIQEEMNRFEAEIHQPQPNQFMSHNPRMFVPPQMRMQQNYPGPGMGHPGGPPGGMMPFNRFQGRPMGPLAIPSQGFIAAPPRPSVAVISAPAQTTTSKSNDDDDDILATLMKYETEVKKETKKATKTMAAGLMPSNVAQQQRKASQTAEASKKAAAAAAKKSQTVQQASTSSGGSGAASGSGALPSGIKAPPSASIGEESLKKAKKQKRIVRTGGGQIWEDETLKEWDPNDFRIFCGDLGNDVTDEVLVRTFSRYPSFVKAKVIRDKKSNKTKGFGFVSFKDPSDFTRAMRELNGKYVGSRPIKLRKSNWKDRNIEVVRTKQKVKQQMGYKW